MARLNINLGTTANDRTGDPIRVAFQKVNQNFDELYSSLGADGQLPPQTGNANKYLKTNGTTLSWDTVTSGVTSYTALTDKPTLFSGSYTDLTSKPTIPTSFSSLVNGANTVSLGTDGSLAYPNTALQRDTATVNCAGNASTVVFTATSVSIHTIRLLIQVEGSEAPSDQWDTQSCEMIIAKSFKGDDIAASVYGIVYTSVAPLATFTALWNALTSRIEVLCATPSANTVSVRIFATEITTAD